jgi:predicted Zn-dependent peptidase
MNRHTLANGLRIVHHEDTTTQMVAVNLLYNVGARHEDAEHTGYAHLLEHLMFEGSTNIPNYDTHVQLAGGENNAWTSNDLTNYYITVPRSNVETAFWLESDRMTGLALTEESLEVQKGVVIEEFKQRHLNRPYGDVQHHIRALSYKVHPYRWPTIGLCVEHIERATLATVMDFYRRHCITLGQEVVVLRADEVRYGTALALDETGSLLVRFTDGSQETVCSGEVSVRGMYGYV